MTVLMPNWYYEKKDLKRSPSIVDGIDAEKESRYRREGARFIINVGTKMGLRYDTMATGVVYFHRFYMFHSFKTFPRYVTACCCLFLAGKVEETPKKCKDIIRTAKSFLTDSQFAQFGDDPKEEVMTLERILLQTIKFDLQVDHPYGHLLKYAKSLKGDNKKLQNMVQMAWTFINDSLCTTLCLQWEPEVIAIALMYLAGKLSKFEVVDWIGRASKHNYWWDMFVEGMSIELLEDICHQVLDLYSTPMSNTPQDSPPATPPTKSTRKSSQPPSPVEAATSPAPLKIKEPVTAGMPIPRLEPGELKRKVSHIETKKEVEGKIPRLEGKAIPIISSSNNSSSPPKRHSKALSSKPTSPITPKPIETLAKAPKHIDVTKRSSVADPTFRSNVTTTGTQPYSQNTSVLSTDTTASLNTAQQIPVTPTTTYSLTLPLPSATYTQPTPPFYTAVPTAAAVETPVYPNVPQPPPQLYPQQFQHLAPLAPPTTTLTGLARPPVQYSELSHQYPSLPPGPMPSYNSQYPPPPPPPIRPPNVINNSLSAVTNIAPPPPSQVSGIRNTQPPPPPPPNAPSRNTALPPPPPGVASKSSVPNPSGANLRNSIPTPPPGIGPRSTPDKRHLAPDQMFDARASSDMYHPQQKGRGLMPPPGRDFSGPRGHFDDSPRMQRRNMDFNHSYMHRPPFHDFDQGFHRPPHPGQFGPGFDGPMHPRRFPPPQHRSPGPRPRMMNNMQHQQQQGTPTGIPPVRITGSMQ